MGNSNVQNSSRKNILKKAAMLATVASITGAIGVGSQKPKESEALIGAIIGIISTVVSVGAGIGSSVAESNAQKEARRQAEAEARRQAEEERRRAEQEAREKALASAEHNIRVQQQEQASEEVGKEINISAADNSALSEQQQQSATSSFSSSINRPTSVPKDINVGGFGAPAEVTEQKVENIESVENEGNAVQDETEAITQDVINESLDTVENNEYELSLNSMNEIESNIVRFSIDDLELEDTFSDVDSSSVVYEDVVAHGLGIVGGEDNNVEYVEIDESNLMSDEEAEQHILVQEGIFTSEDVILLDFGIRSGAITQEVLNIMYENQEISDEYYEGAVILMAQIYDEFENANN